MVVSSTTRNNVWPSYPTGALAEEEFPARILSVETEQQARRKQERYEANTVKEISQKQRACSRIK